MSKNRKIIPTKLKSLLTEQNATISYAALWYGIISACVLWMVIVGLGTLIVLASTNGTIYAMAGILKLATWMIFFLGGFIAGYKAGFRGWQHGLWAGLFLGLFSVIFLLEIVPSIISWEQVLFQWAAAVILGISGGIAGLRILKYRRDRKGYSFKQAKKERFMQLDRGN
ncbi:MAG: hypothetical protein ACOWWO_06520 [Peptococcaceae bacterium]